MAYIPPSVIVNAPAVSNGSTAFVQPSTMALIAKLADYPSTTTTRLLSNGSTVTIYAKNLILSKVSLASQDGTALVKDTDYSVAQSKDLSNFSITITNADISTQPISISYAWLPDNFFEPLRWFSKQSVEAFYGTGFDDNGNVVSAASAAADFAFDNGATSICIIPVIAAVDNNPGNTLQSALESLKIQEDVTLVTFAGLSADEMSLVAAHVAWCNSNALERRGVFALDGTSSTYSVDQLCNFARNLNNDDIMFIPNNIASILPSSSSNPVNAPGWLFSAAVCGLIMQSQVWESLTRSNVYGFYGVQNFLYEEKNTLAASGCTVIEKSNSSMRIRHGIATTQSSIVEWSYGAVRQSIIRIMRTALDIYVGLPSTAVILSEMSAKVDMILTQQQSQQIIADFSDVSVTNRAGSPGTIDVEFKYKWLASIDWIYVTFSVDSE
jgi:hypothetical protein